MTDGQLPAIRLYKFISPGLLKTMGNQLVAGRDFTWAETYEKRPVVMVSENLARELWRDPAAAIGKRVRENLKTPWHEIIGVVGDEHDDGLNQKAPSIVLWPILMENFAGDQTFARRTLSYMIRSTRTGSSGFVKEIGQAVWSVNPESPARQRSHAAGGLRHVSCAHVVHARHAGDCRQHGAAAGNHGDLRRPFVSVSQRTREIGIRMALGARGEEVMRMFVGYGFRLASIGVACGLLAAVALTRLMSSLLFDVTPSDPLTLGAVSVGLMIAALLASYLPAARATSVNPVDALRAE